MTCIIGLDGIEREWAEVFAAGEQTRGHAHGLDTTAGYIVRRTFFDEREHEDVATINGRTNYEQALVAVREVRAEQTGMGYAVIDFVYECGCRSAA